MLLLNRQLYNLGKSPHDGPGRLTKLSWGLEPGFPFPCVLIAKLVLWATQTAGVAKDGLGPSMLALPRSYSKYPYPGIRKKPFGTSQKAQWVKVPTTQA